jgi:DNA (cytosine-5)-methyltransferase 1
MRHGSLFSGIGGFDLASEWMGWENVFHCEWMEFPRKVLDYYWPGADSHIDICKTDFKKYEGTIDIITGGFPCQPFSTAGKRKGKNDERYLWGEMLRAIQEIKPKFVIAENVFGITNIDGGLVFEQVCLDLEDEGYEVQPFIIPAASKNAPHRRDRVWFIAYANGNDGRSTNRESGCKESKTNGQGKQSVYSRTWTTSNEGDATNTKCSRGLQISKNIQSKQSNGEKLISTCWKWNATDTSSERLSRSRNTRKIFDKKEIMGNKINQFTNNITTNFKQCDWSKFPTQSPICSRSNGIPNELDGITFSKWRNESIKGYGNAIVPQVAFELFKQLGKL